jgi:hypothetical protein
VLPRPEARLFLDGMVAAVAPADLVVGELLGSD